MHILQIAPALAPVRADSPDPIAATVYHLIDVLVERGHDVTLWGAPGSKTRARLRTISTPLPAHDAPAAERLIYERLFAFAAASDTTRYDVIHNHAGEHVGELLNQFDAPAFSTVYTVPPSRPGATLRYRRAFATPSWRQRMALAGAIDAPFLGVIYPGLPVADLPYEPEPGEYLLYAGPLTPAAGFDLAVAAARRAELPLRVCGERPARAQEYWQPLLAQNGHAVYLGEPSWRELAAQAAGARAMLCTARTSVAFDFAAVLAQATGTPVVGQRRGVLPELVVHGETGLLVEEPWQLVGAIDSADLIQRCACRRRAEQLFDAEHMVDQFEALYADLARGGSLPAAQHPELEALDPREVLEVA
ncbi:MAG TPA: glycosyltransferase [Dehalococcoidia bacterium]